jgi:hypothetical protein
MEKVISINDDWRWIIGGGNILKKTWRNRKRPIMIYTYCYNLFLAYKVCLWKFGNYYNLFFAYKVCLWKFEYYCCPLIKDG